MMVCVCVFFSMLLDLYTVSLFSSLSRSTAAPSYGCCNIRR